MVHGWACYIDTGGNGTAAAAANVSADAGVPALVMLQLDGKTTVYVSANETSASSRSGGNSDPCGSSTVGRYKVQFTDQDFTKGQHEVRGWVVKSKSAAPGQGVVLGNSPGCIAEGKAAKCN